MADNRSGAFTFQLGSEAEESAEMQAADVAVGGLRGILEALLPVDLEEFKQRLNIPADDTTLECALIFHEARGLESRGQFDDAVNAYKKVLELAPGDAVAYARLASLYVQRRTPRAAVMVYVALAEMHVAVERWEKAAAAYEKASELAPDDAEIH